MKLALTGAALALAAAAACIVLGLAVLAQPPRTGAQSPAARLAASLLGTDGDAAALDAAAAAVRAHTPAALARVERALAPLGASGPAGRRSWADTLAAVLELQQAQAQGGPPPLGHAVAALDAAVGADATNEVAKRNLELLLTLQQEHGGHRRPQRSRRHHNGRQKPAATAGYAAPGSGW